VNHVPDEALAAIDEFGESFLLDAASAVSVRLRRDLKLRVTPTGDGTAVCRFQTTHRQTPPTVRDRGSFVATVVDGVDDRFRSWGIDPPDAYEYDETVDGVHYYVGTLRLP
jgi:hypothetical protein